MFCFFGIKSDERKLNQNFICFFFRLCVWAVTHIFSIFLARRWGGRDSFFLNHPMSFPLNNRFSVFFSATYYSVDRPFLMSSSLMRSRHSLARISIDYFRNIPFHVHDDQFYQSHRINTFNSFLSYKPIYRCYDEAM